MTKTKRIQILCLLGAVTPAAVRLLDGSPRGVRQRPAGDQEPADQQEEVILPAAFTLPYDRTRRWTW